MISAKPEDDERNNTWVPAPAPEKPSLEESLEDDEMNDVYAALEPGTAENESWNPDALNFDSWSEPLREDARQIEEKYGIDVVENFATAEIFPHPGNSKASTRTRTFLNSSGAGVENRLGYDPLDYAFDTSQEVEKTLLHENYHAEASRGKARETLQQRMNDNTASYLSLGMRYGDHDFREGATEFSALYTHENGEELAGSSYLFETAEVSRQLYQEGVHPDPELAEALEEEVDQVMDLIGLEKDEGASYHEDGLDAYSPENVPDYLEDGDYEEDTYFRGEEEVSGGVIIEEGEADYGGFEASPCCC
ncbi:MAG: hypothetical protein ABEJ93_05290 [Candidatus Nanohalobium sp.]